MRPSSDEIRREIADILGIPEDHVSDDLAAGSIPEWDSLAQLAIVSALEEKHKLHIPEEQLMRLSSVTAIEEYVTRGELPEISSAKDEDTKRIPLPEDTWDEVPLEHHRQSLVETLQQRASLHPRKPAIVFEDGPSLTYAGLAEGARQAAVWLQRQGVCRGGRIALCAEKRREFFLFLFGAHLLGVTTLIFDERIPSEVGRNIFRLANISLSYGSAGCCDSTYPTNLSEKEEPEHKFANLQPNESAIILLTTGTTGTPKLVELTHANIAAYTLVDETLGITSSTRELIAMPLYHVFGLGMICRVLAEGGCVILPSNLAQPAVTLNLAGEYQATGMTINAAGWHYLEHLTGKDNLRECLQSLRRIVMASMAITAELRAKMMELLPQVRLCIGYGLTEATLATLMCCNDETGKSDTVGRPSPEVEVCVFAENGLPVVESEHGEICIKGPIVMKRYLNVLSDNSFYGNFFRSGDWGYVDAEGYVHLSGRMKDIINVGGEKVSPEEVEAVLNLVPGVAESACVPTPDPKGILGEVVKAILVADPAVPRPTDEQIQTAVAVRLERFKVPRIIEWREKLARTASGKLQRCLMR